MDLLQAFDLSVKTYKLEKVAVLYLAYVNYIGAKQPLSGISETLGNFKEIFVKPTYTLFFKEDGKMNETNKKIEEIRSEVNKKENAFDGLIVLINGHGDIGKDDGEMKGKRCFLTVEGQPMYVDDLMERFSDTNCPLLVGKPKLFFIDTCQGEKIDKGHVGQGKGAKPEVKDEEVEETFIRFPSGADILLARSSRKGYMSRQIYDVGSLFLGTLYRAIELYGAEKDILSLLTLTQSAISEFTLSTWEKIEMTEKGDLKVLDVAEASFKQPVKKEPTDIYEKIKIHEKQMPNFYSTLTKFFILPVPEKQ